MRPARAVRIGAAVLVAAAMASSPWWGRIALRSLAFFRLRSVEVVGAYAIPSGAIVDRLRMDTTASVWDNLAPLAARVARIPGIHAVSVRRALPGTLVVTVTESVPVAVVPTGNGMRPYDADGVALPFDPSRADFDVPVLARPDRRALGLLDDVRRRAPALFGRISEVRVESNGELVIETPAFVVRAGPDADAARLAEAIPVAADLARRRVRVQELDVRFRDQIVARRA